MSFEDASNAIPQYSYTFMQAAGRLISTDQDPIGQLVFDIGSPVAGKESRPQDLLKNLRLKSGW